MLRIQPLATGTSDVIVALVPNTTFGANLQDVVDVLTAELARVGLTLVLRFSSSPVELLEHFITTIRPRAVIAPFVAATAAERESIEASGVTLIDLAAAEDVNYRIGRLQGEHLASKGYQNLVYAHLHDARLDVYGDSRERGLADYCRESGRAAPKSIRLSVDLLDAVSVLSGLPRGVAIACYNDDVAVALLAAAREIKRRVPEVVALLGVDATRIGALMAPRLTTISVDTTIALQALVHDIVSRLSSSAAADSLNDLLALTVIPGGSA
ncbi:substrate-binding domain-containing protein [Microbacterium sp. Root553]|uniref:substrate-binding domain-containing protein n=1 Tax=Microbacterium sp. Root553 TaxID=1736556 RepID=UPI0006FEC841|nr:substrate-binding domain-containing protein [Microbacterium sp. Root553]KQZ23247.1 hypothetical protein ASD43_01850 [Microbacterium sp. Root553]